MSLLIPCVYNQATRSNWAWTLTWNGGPATFDATRLDRERAHVLLSPPDSLVRAGGGLKSLADDLFPPTVAATDGLHSVVLDYAPPLG